MKCRTCGQPAIINMRQHKLALCRAHFVDWLPAQIEHVIHKYQMFTPADNILVAVSGGKDSLSLWDILTRLGYPADGVYISLGIDGPPGSGLRYSEESRRLTEQFAAARGLRLHVIDIAAAYGATIPDLARRTRRGHDKPCSVCGLVKRYLMNRTAREGGYTVLATGHNLDDEAAVLMQNTLAWSADYLVRQAPVLPATGSGLARKVKPLCRVYEREMAAYALASGIEYIYDECPYAVGSNTLWYKELLNQMEEKRPGLKQQYYLAFLQAKEAGLFAPAADNNAELHTCDTCGQPTIAPGRCSFCRLWEKAPHAPPENGLE
jgi:tRNA-5-methyluridine54 2-sulfurtransferase